MPFLLFYHYTEGVVYCVMLLLRLDGHENRKLPLCSAFLNVLIDLNINRLPEFRINPPVIKAP